MGTIVDQESRLAAFNGDVFPKGLDLRRSVIAHDLGTYVALSSATIRMGQFVAMDADGFIIPGVGADTIGVAKWNKQNFGISVNVDEPVVLTGLVASNLKRGNVQSVSVRSLPNMGGTQYIGDLPGLGTNYTVNAGNGTITRVGGGIPDGATVYVTYTYDLVDADFEFDGRDFRNQSNNDVLGQEDRMAVITDWSKLFTMEYAAGRQYSRVGPDSKLYVDDGVAVGSLAGQATNEVGLGTDFVGRVIQIPNTEDPFLGMHISGNPTP